jgi:hypothetical protein
VERLNKPPLELLVLELVVGLSLVLAVSDGGLLSQPIRTASNAANTNIRALVRRRIGTLLMRRLYQKQVV